MLVTLDTITAPLEDVSDRRIGGEAHGLIAQQVTDVIGAAGGAARLGAIVAHRGEADSQARGAGYRSHNADIGNRAIHAAGAFKARREIINVERAAILRFQPRDKDRRVPDIMLGGRNLPFEFEPPHALVLLVAIEQGAENGVSVDAGDAAPDEPALLVYQRAYLAIADRREFQILFVHRSSHLCTAATSSR